MCGSFETKRQPCECHYRLPLARFLSVHLSSQPSFRDERNKWEIHLSAYSNDVQFFLPQEKSHIHTGIAQNTRQLCDFSQIIGKLR
jgi:hypothetical protein